MSWIACKRAVKEILEDVVIERNLVANPSAEAGITLITATGPTLTQDATQFRFGTKSLKATGSAGATDLVEWFAPTGAKIAVTANEPYAASVYAMVTATTPTVRVGIKWYTAADVFISESTSANNTLTAAEGWEYLSLEATAPSTAAFAVPNVREATALWPNGTNIYFDGVMFNAGYARPYIDGDQPGCDWDTSDPDQSKRIIKKVYEDPPGVIQDFPCFVLFEGAIESTQLPQWRKDARTLDIQFFAGDQDKDISHSIAVLAREQVKTAFDSDFTLGGNADVACLEGAPEMGSIEYPVGSGKLFAGFTARLVVRTSEVVAWAP